MHKKLQVLKDIRKYMSSGCLLCTAIERAGVKSPQTIKNWRDKTPRIARYINACKERSDNKRTDVVEDAFFKKLASGEGSPTDYIFYLTNRRPERWKHQNSLVNVNVGDNAGGTKIETPHAVIFSAIREECEKDECQTHRQ